jgi:hypothetical protein
MNMITTPSGSEKITVHGSGPKSEVMALTQLRDAAGYSKQFPLPARTATISGVVKLAGSTVAIETTGIVDGNVISALAATDGLLGAAVVSDGLPPETTVVGIIAPASPGLPGRVALSNAGPFPPTTGNAQPVKFAAIVRASVISGLPATEGLAGAHVSGGGLPDGTIIQSISVPAVPASNMHGGAPGEVLLLLPVVPVKAVEIQPQPAPVPLMGPGPASGPAFVPGPQPGPAPLQAEVPPPPAPAANLDPVDLTFAIPTQPIAMPDNISRLILIAPASLDALTVTLPARPVDGQLAFVSSELAIAELTIVAAPGQRLRLPPGDFAPKAPEDGGCVGYLYSAPDSTWDRIQ